MCKALKQWLVKVHSISESVCTFYKHKIGECREIEYSEQIRAMTNVTREYTASPWLWPKWHLWDSFQSNKLFEMPFHGRYYHSCICCACFSSYFKNINRSQNVGPKSFSMDKVPNQFDCIHAPFRSAQLTHSFHCEWYKSQNMEQKIMYSRTLCWLEWK